MTRNEFIAAWAGASPAARLQNFRQWVNEELSGVDDLLQPISITDDAGVTSVSRPSTYQFVVTSAFFQDANPADAVALGEFIVDALMVTAMENHYKKQKERQQYEKDYRKEQAKKYDKMAKEGKPKGSKAGYGAYLYGKYMKELEYGSG